jgi:phage antirepressor YoqD-like protein
MSYLNILSKPTATMSSREIAELVDSRHDKVKQSIERLFAKGVIPDPPVGEYQDSLGRPAGEYRLDKRSSLIVVAQLCPEFTARIVDRWQELEGQVAAPAVPQSLSAALRLAADQAEQIEAQQALLAIAAPKVAFVDRYVVATGLKGFREVCKLLGANEARFREFLTDNKIMYRLGGSMTAHAQHLDAGRFEVRAGASEVSGHAFNACKFTSKGVEWVAGEWAKHQIRAEVAA